jgi:hypothetical protein
MESSSPFPLTFSWIWGKDMTRIKQERLEKVKKTCVKNLRKRGLTEFMPDII